MRHNRDLISPGYSQMARSRFMRMLFDKPRDENEVANQSSERVSQTERTPVSQFLDCMPTANNREIENVIGNV